MKNFANNLIAQGMFLNTDEEGNPLSEVQQINNPVLDPTIPLEQLKAQASRPQIFRPEAEQEMEIPAISQTIPNYNQLAQAEAENQEAIQDISPQVSSNINSTAPASVSRAEQLWQEYSNLLGKDREALKQAREQDRMLRVGGAIGDALATYINARNQMNVKAPGVQVQQGAGLGKIADLFATAPEIQSDLTDRRADLLAQYKALAEGDTRDLQRRRIAAYEKQVENTGKRAEEKPTVGEQTVDREFAKKYNEWRTGGKADYEENKKIFDEAISALEKGDISTGTAAGIGARFPGVRTETRELENRVRKALNSMLRATYGAQFTQEEGERLFQQTFDPFASSAENIKNMQTELSKIEKRARYIESQGQFFTKQKTLSGFEPNIQTETDSKQLSPKDKQALDWANKNPNDPRAEQIKRRLGM